MNQLLVQAAPDTPDGLVTMETCNRLPISPPSASYSFLLPPLQQDEIGRLGNYRILRLLGKGGMGFVFHAEDLTLCRPVALKVMKPDLKQDFHGWERFLREARVMAAIKHDSLVTVYQVAQENDVAYLAMELLDGMSLDEWLNRIRQPDVPAILSVARQMASGLSAIHQRDLVHRDIKPANLWMEPSGRVKILDFGLVRCVNEDVALTQTGSVMGTPCFMAPEQARGEPADSRSDLFSFGCVLYNLCTGTSPFQAKNTTAVLTALAVHHPRPVIELNPSMPRALSELAAQLLAKDPKDRPRSAAAVLEQLERVAPSPPSSHTLVVVPDVQGSPAPKKEAPPVNRNWMIAGLAIALSVAAGCLVPLVMSSGGRSDRAGEESSTHQTRQEEVPSEVRVSPNLADQGTVEITEVVAAPSQMAADEAQPKPIKVPVAPPSPQAPPAAVSTRKQPAEAPTTAPKKPAPPAVPPPPKKIEPATVYLSDLEPAAKINWPFIPPLPPGAPEIQPLGGVHIRGRKALHGIFMHPPPSQAGSASITYALQGKFKTLRGEVSLNDGPNRSESPVLFAVYGDGRLLWKSRPLSSQADAQNFNIPVSGVERLKIDVSVGGEPRGAHAVWVDPVLSR